jgi:hypothetical protein
MTKVDGKLALAVGRAICMLEAREAPSSSARVL